MRMMKPTYFYFICCSIATSGALVHSQIVPTFYVASLIDTVRANGSSPTGHCVGFDITSPNVYCNAPGTSVLFDGHIPTLSDVGGDTWASDLLTLRTEANINLFESYVSMLYMFHNQRDYSGVRRMELVLFNCPQWGISVGSVEVNEFNSENTTTLAIQSVGTSSCDSLVRVCVSVSTASTNLQVKFLSVPATDFYVYIAEITFYADSSSCPPEALVSTDTVTTAGGSPDLTTDSTPGSNPTCSTQREACPSCAATNSWTPVVAATSTALLAVLVFALVQIAICKCRQRGGKERGEREDPVYDQISEEEESSAMFSTWMTITRNESYSTNPLALHVEQLAEHSSGTTEPFYDYMLRED